MNIEDYRTYCLSLGDDVEEKMPFGAFKYADGFLVFYVCGHMFAFLDTNNFTHITLKCPTADIDELRAQYPCIGKPFNMSPRHWIGIDPLTADKPLLQRLTRQSYEIVKLKYTHHESTIDKRKSP